jgi:hypothetical protein
MSGISSILEIILVEEKTGKKPNPQTGQFPVWKEARAILRKENGEVATVGRMRVPRDLEGQVTTGLFTAVFGLSVRDYGDNAGEIQATITALTPLDPKAIRMAPASAPAPAAVAPSKAS